ncbi:response regulator [bacterium]|nr:MAG: response regulator [bacterium]
MTKILLVEDDKSLREIYGVRLLAEGYDIVSAGDGEEALAMAIKERPELIVSDVMMPKISGFDMLDILRSTTETRDIKVIMMTALSSEDQRARGEQLGADRYLVKSQVGIEDVVRTVHDVLGDAGSAPAPAAPQQPQTDAPATAVVNAPQPATPPAPASSLPLPTAPFSSPRPATLGERVINPLESAEPTVSSSVKSQIEQELQAPVVPVTATQVDSATDDDSIALQLGAVQPQAPQAPAAPQQPSYPQEPVVQSQPQSADDDTTTAQPQAPQPPVSPLS